MKTWTPSLLPGSYVSSNGRITAELRPAGKYDGEKLVRHYAIRNRLSPTQTVIGTARTLKEAAEMYA
jgi:hypothetical protein